MAKAVLISIRPKWVEKILSGEKTLELRKTRPKLETPFKCYIYCTNSGVAMGMWGKHGKIVGEFVCDRIDPIVPAPGPYGIYDVDDDFVAQTRLVDGALWDYGKGATLYGWHISKLEIYDAPKSLYEFGRICDKECNCDGCAKYWANGGDCGINSLQIKRPPQSWCYVEGLK
nr:MAG TPA: hypothetical protein [Caudoviricetes sp.]